MTKPNDHKSDLSCVKRLTVELSKALSNTQTGRSQAAAAQEIGTAKKEAENPFALEPGLQMTWLFACLVSLSKRRLLPHRLAGGPLEQAISPIAQAIFGFESLQTDNCAMANAAGLWIENLFGCTDSDNLEEATRRTIDCLLKWTKRTQDPKPKEEQFSDIARAALSDSLFSGWVYQYLLHRSGRQLKKNASSDEHTPSYTKWFTPSWIAEFLVEEAITKPNQTFIDPACGAGHILVPAFNRSVALLVESGSSKSLAVKTAIEDLIYGLDIDAQLTASANFSLYLACRDIDEKIELPAAGVFAIEGRGGSLQLKAMGSSSADLLLSDASESRFPLSKLPQEFGALAANPPYMSLRNMPEDTSEFLKQHYPVSKYDLYSAFVELSIGMLEKNARASMICQQSVLSISRFKPLREFIEQQSTIETIVQLGSGSFPARAGEKVNNAIITFRRRADDDPSSCSPKMRFARILYPEQKKQAEIFGIKSLLNSTDMETINSTSTTKPTIAPWCPPGITALFDKHPPLQDSSSGIVVVNGLFTCNNKMFVRRFDEVSEDERHEYVPYDKGGGKKWFHSTPYLLHWQKDGDAIREYRASRGQSRSLPGENYYFQPGITYSYIGTQGFKARLLSPDSVFDIASSSVFTPEPLRMYMLGFMNSSLVRYLMGVLNPTINFQIGDLRRLPYAKPDSMTQFAVSKLAEEAVDLARKVENMEGNLIDLNFIAWAKSKEKVIQSEIDKLIFALYKIPAKLQRQVLEDPWVVRGQKNVFAMPSNTTQARD